MREIDVLNPQASTFIHALVLGAPKSGKTHFAASAPKPLFISDVAEGGYATIANMDKALWWDVNDPPQVWAIEDVLKDLGPMLLKLETLKAQGAFPFHTVIVDPISLYMDRAYAELLAQHKAKSKSGDVDGRQVYGDLAMHVRSLIFRIHALPAHILWLSHVKDGGISVPGATAEKLPAYMDYTWLCTNSASDGYKLHTAPFGAYSILGSRYSWANSKGQRFGLPNPMIPSFKALAQIMKLGYDPVSPAMPGFPEGAKYDWPPEPQES